MPWLMVAYRYWRQLAALFLALVLVAVCYYIGSLQAERTRLRQENTVLTVQLQGAVAVQELANRMTEAIGQIRIRSNVNVSRIESEPAPQFVDSRPLPFIPAGVRPFGLHTSHVADGAGTAPATGGPVSAGEPRGGVLPQ